MSDRGINSSPMYPFGSRSFYNRHFVWCSLRILLLSDIHANLEALEACLAAAPAFDFVANLGDVVGYGASPNEVIERARGLGKIFVRGNHDKAATGLLELHDFNPMAAAAAIWTREQLTPEHSRWLHVSAARPASFGRLSGSATGSRLAGG